MYRQIHTHLCIRDGVQTSKIYTSSVACAIGTSVTTSSTDFSFQNLDFWNLFAFSAAEIT